MTYSVLKLAAIVKIMSGEVCYEEKRDRYDLIETNDLWSNGANLLNTKFAFSLELNV